jgi:hypothetical protein
MTYVLEKTTLTDMEKIVTDAKCDPERLRTLERWPLLRADPGATWAIDRSRDIYIHWIPGKSESDGKYLHFFYKKNLYQIELEGSLGGNLVKFTHEPYLPIALLHELQHEIRNALAVYGRFGGGDGGGDWMLKVDATFETKE